FVLVTLFAGSVETTFSDDSFTIKASFYDDLTVAYDRVESVEYRDGNVPGSRVFGVGSFRLLLGTFENEEFGNYTRYTYYKPEACVVLKVNGKTLVLSGRDAAETQSIYQQLLDKTQ
ncbi:MAG: PH domain-containing protein, partial [Firmicutes bacterium]|nr:PH domain-containing protein [Bacillota bacterium]